MKIVINSLCAGLLALTIPSYSATSSSQFLRETNAFLKHDFICLSDLLAHLDKAHTTGTLTQEMLICVTQHAISYVQESVGNLWLDASDTKNHPLVQVLAQGITQHSVNYKLVRLVLLIYELHATAPSLQRLTILLAQLEHAKHHLEEFSVDDTCEMVEIKEVLREYIDQNIEQGKRYLDAHSAANALTACLKNGIGTGTFVTGAALVPTVSTALALGLLYGLYYITS